ncbi:unnamed protein product [Phytophthora lilii]|uniref:Unnamed protein product n=1 Tax=Phytophthora lilii TaxID=2077276 RepID=A0A9W6WPJ8_9STRA|nr:unnamed protein product [Phytophthora lilii]
MVKQKEKCVYDDIARQQAEAAAKLDALHGVGNGEVTEFSMAMRRTSFKLNEADTGVITYVCTRRKPLLHGCQMRTGCHLDECRDRIRQYSSKLGGSRKDRQKFLRRNSKTKTVSTVDINDPAQEAAAEAAKALPTIEPSKPETKKRGNRNKRAPIDSIVEEAVDATL